MANKPVRWCATHNVEFKNWVAEKRHKATHSGCHIGWRLKK